MTRLLVLRPEPGASATAARAQGAGFAVTIAPLFKVAPLTWTRPTETVDAVMLTSANAARHGGPGLADYFDLPCHVVGTATAEAARAAGFGDVRIGGPDAASLAASLSGAGRVLHLAGREHRPALPGGGILRTVYAADAVAVLPGTARAAVAGGAVTLLHSARAAMTFAALANAAALDRSTIRIAALSPAVAEAAGPGWAAVHVALTRDDMALLTAITA